MCEVEISPFGGNQAGLGDEGTIQDVSKTQVPLQVHTVQARLDVTRKKMFKQANYCHYLKSIHRVLRFNGK